MTKHKNTILILISLILFAYAGILSIVPTILTKTFNKAEFCKNIEDDTGLVTTIDTIQYQIKPNLNMIISISDWSSKYIDDQDCFEAAYMEITVNPLSIFTRNVTLKDMFVNNARFSNQVLSNGKNKLADLPKYLGNATFDSKKATLTVAGPVRVKNFTIVEIAPGYYNEKVRANTTYSRADVKTFLQKINFTNVTIK